MLSRLSFIAGLGMMTKIQSQFEKTRKVMQGQFLNSQHASEHGSPECCCGRQIPRLAAGSSSCLHAR